MTKAASASVALLATGSAPATVVQSDLGSGWTTALSSVVLIQFQSGPKHRTVDWCRKAGLPVKCTATVSVAETPCLSGL